MTTKRHTKNLEREQFIMAKVRSIVIDTKTATTEQLLETNTFFFFFKYKKFSRIFLILSTHQSHLINK